MKNLSVFRVLLCANLFVHSSCAKLRSLKCLKEFGLAGLKALKGNVLDKDAWTVTDLHLDLHIIRVMSAKRLFTKTFPNALKQSFALKPALSPAFSLVEMLMALLVASILLAALAPVMTRKFGETVNVGDVGGKAMQEMTFTFNYNDEYCNEIDEENNVCKGAFTIPSESASTAYVTLIGAGGGGGAAASTGSIEYTTAGMHTFTVPQGVYEVELTMISGGNGADGVVIIRYTLQPNY